MRAGILNAILHSLLFFHFGMLSHAPACQTPPVHAESVTVEDARELVKKSTLKMGMSLKITELDPEVAAALSHTKGLLSLNGLHTIDAESALALTSTIGLSLELNGLEEITPQVATALARSGYLRLNALKPGSDVIRELGNRSGSLELNALESLDVESATHLVKQASPLSLNGVKSVSFEVAKVLAASRASISMEGLEELSVDSQNEFAKHTGGWRFQSLRSLQSTMLAENLAGQEVGVALPKLEDVSIDCLSILATSKWSVSLGIRELTVEQAQALSRCNSRLSLTRISQLTKEQIDILLQCPAKLEFRGLSELLDARLAERLAKDASRMLRIDQVESLSGEAAAAIATGKHILPLSKLRSLDSMVASALATHRGHIILSGLDEMSDEHAELFAARDGSLYLSSGMVISDHARQRLESNKQIKWKK
jgi:hypothetical protein